MKLKNTIIQILGIILVLGMSGIVDAQTRNSATAEVEQQSKDPEKLRDDLKRFDSDGDGTLSDIEREEMLNTIALEAFLGTTIAQQPQRARRFRGGRRGPRQQEMIADRFDLDKDGKLNDEEHQAARKYIQESRGEIAPSRPSGRTSPDTDLQDDLRASKAVKSDGKPGLYDEKTLRTLYLRFPNDDWYEALGDFYRTDVDVKADLIIDGKVYRSVGVHFRGSSSYFGIMDSEKKSLNIAIDADNENQRLYGYKTLNLLNGHSDPSFIREVLYSKISREYLPAPKVNFVKLMINGENWGVYVNTQQFNKDFLAEWFGNKDGVRWKVPPGRDGGLVYNGDDPASYQRSFQLKTQNAKGAWNDLIQLCKVLDQTPDDQLEKELSAMFNMDRALWFIALENIFIDNDGYLSRGSDYAIYQDVLGRFHLLPHDSNETFRYAGGGGPNSWPDGSPMISPVVHESDEMRPVIKRLLAIPHLRARYLAHIRTIVDEWLDWSVLGPIIKEYQSLIDAEVKNDDKKLYSYEVFATSHTKDIERNGRGHMPSFKRFIEERREFLLNHEEIDRQTPTITSVSKPVDPLAGQPVQITAEIAQGSEVESAILYYATSRLASFESVLMSAKKKNTYVGEIPAFPAGTKVRYYVEARAVAYYSTTNFYPAKTEFAPLTYRVTPPIAGTSSVVINELMANNTQSLTDPQGEHDDWIELYNKSTEVVSLAGMYLSDSRKNPRKWAFPENTKIAAGGYLIIWADENGKDQPGLHTNFKLSKSGETVMLIDTDKRGNQLLDSVKFDKQKKDTAIGRFPDGTGDFTELMATPGKLNSKK